VVAIGASAATAASNQVEAMMNLVAEIVNYKIEDAEGEWNGTKNVMIGSHERDVFCNHNSFDPFLRCTGFIVVPCSGRAVHYRQVGNKR
jgi:hypothetical protein